jgi:thiol-disulfide isomerase/thioredoxin
MSPLRLLVCLALLAVPACSSGLAPPSGDVAAGLALQTLDGAAFDPQQLRGRPAVVMFWRTGCPYCHQELPVIEQVAAERGAAAVAVLVAGNQRTAADLAGKHPGVTFLVDDGSLRERYAIRSVPYTLVLRPDGTARRAFRGAQGAGTLASALPKAK